MLIKEVWFKLLEAQQRKGTTKELWNPAIFLKWFTVNNHSENKFYDFCHIIPRASFSNYFFKRLDKDNESKGHNIKGWNLIYTKGNTQKI